MLSGWSIGNRKLVAAAIILLIIGLTATITRTIKKYQVPGPPDPDNEGYCDFHNGIYYPSIAMLDGVSPYGSKYAADYPVSRQIPFFSPAIVAIHAPLALLPLRFAEILYFVFMVGLIFAIAATSVIAAGLEKRFDWVAVVAAGIVFSRAGHITLFNGYFTFELVLAVILAIRYAESRPLLSAIALMIVSGKPTYILPLGFLMLARGNLRSLVYGAIMSIIAAIIPFAWLAWNEGDGNMSLGLSEIRQQIVDSQAVHHHEPNELPALSWTRIDAYAIFAKWTNEDPEDLSHLLVMLGILTVPMFILWRRRKVGHDDGVAGITGTLIVAAMIVGLYRQFYDVLLLVPPIVGVVAAKLPEWQALGDRKRFCFTILMLFPAFNYLTTRLVMDRFELATGTVNVLTSVNAVAMVGLLFWILVLASKGGKTSSGVNSPQPKPLAPGTDSLA